MKVKIEADFPESMRKTFEALAQLPGAVSGDNKDLLDAFEMSDNFTVTHVEVEAE